jgi:hypothetical protein
MISASEEYVALATSRVPALQGSQVHSVPTESTGSSMVLALLWRHRVSWVCASKVGRRGLGTSRVHVQPELWVWPGTPITGK